MSGIKKLLRISDENGKPSIEEIASGTIFRNLLQSSEAFILYDGDKVIYLYVGSKASYWEENTVESIAKEYISKKKLDAATQLVTVKGGEENADFEAVFKQYTPEPEAQETDGI